ncbi:MAG: nucleoside-diphosphate sugar epimerase/dehydratase [Pseudomonadota bacterium]
MSDLQVDGWQQRAIAILLDLPRYQKRIVQVAVDSSLISACFAFAMLLRLESTFYFFRSDFWIALAIVLPISLIIFIRLGFYREVVRSLSIKAFTNIAFGVLASAVALYAISQAIGLFVPRTVSAIYFCLCLISVGGIRVVLRSLLNSSQHREAERVVIYGAGSTGRQLAGALGRDGEFKPVAFVDDNPELRRVTINGLRVFRSSDVADVVNRFGAASVLLAMPSISRRRRSEVVASLQAQSVQAKTVPRMADLVSGRAVLNELRDVHIEDLLSREPVAANEENPDKTILNKIVLVTGAGGSIGAQLCRQIALWQPKKVVLLEMSEPALYEIDRDLHLLKREDPSRPDFEIEPVLGSALDRDLMRSVLNEHTVSTVFHAAAYKHVPLVEANIVEGVRNNVFGTWHALEAAAEAGVETFVLVSTDKAVRPTNVMGASKRLAEMVCQAKQELHPDMRIAMVRFGNVIGSSGSVIPLFRKQIAQGGPVTVTDEKMTRYFMTIPEAAQLVVEAASMAKGGEVFLLDMGKPVRIVDLAERLIRLSGLTPYFPDANHGKETIGDIAITFTGVRPGEKIYEELLVSSDALKTDHPKIQCGVEEFLTWNELMKHLNRLREGCEKGDESAVRSVLLDIPLHYRPAMEALSMDGSLASDEKSNSLMPT